jgi:hypothetical protein
VAITRRRTHDACDRPRRIWIIGRAATCDSLNQLHADTIRATDAAYARALTDRGLRVVDVPVVATEGRAMPPDDQVHTFERGGHRYTFVPAASYASTHSVPSTAVLVTDGTGNVWKVKRAPRVRPVHQATVEACSFGCWGDPGAGVEPWEWSEHWVLGEAHRYQGEIEIAYDAPTIDLTIIDQDCPLPP